MVLNETSGASAAFMGRFGFYSDYKLMSHNGISACLCLLGTQTTLVLSVVSFRSFLPPLQSVHSLNKVHTHTHTRPSLFP